MILQKESVKSNRIENQYKKITEEIDTLKQSKIYQIKTMSDQYTEELNIEKNRKLNIKSQLQKSQNILNLLKSQQEQILQQQEQEQQILKQQEQEQPIQIISNENFT